MTVLVGSVRKRFVLEIFLSNRWRNKWFWKEFYPFRKIGNHEPWSFCSELHQLCSGAFGFEFSKESVSVKYSAFKNRILLFYVKQLNATINYFHLELTKSSFWVSCALDASFLKWTYNFWRILPSNLKNIFFILLFILVLTVLTICKLWPVLMVISTLRKSSTYGCQFYCIKPARDLHNRDESNIHVLALNENFCCTYLNHVVIFCNNFTVFCLAIKRNLTITFLGLRKYLCEIIWL